MTTRPRLGAAILLAALLAGTALAWALLGGGDAARRYSALFTNARGLVAGNDVRVAGAVAGRVRDVRLAHDGKAEVVFDLRPGVAAPRADAAAAIRPVDLLGDTYLALSPGSAAAPRHGPIPTSRTSNAPRLDELLRTFSPPVRSGLKALIVEAGLALDRRGGDVARTAVALRPALAAAARVTTELDGQDAALARLVPSAQSAASQLGERSADLDPLLDDLAVTLGATANHAQDLDATLAGLPATLRRVRTTSGRLSQTVRAAQPVAATLRDSAPSLAAALRELTPFTTRATTTIDALAPVVRSLRRTLAGGRTSLPQLDRALQTLLGATPDIRALLDAVAPAAPGIAKGFLVNFPDQAAEPGNQPADPGADPRRRYWRGAAVFSCEAFGVPVKPGCLDKVLASFAPARSKGRRKAVTPSLLLPTAGTKPHVPLPMPDIPTVQRKLDDVGKALGGDSTGPADGGAGDLLDYLLGR